MQIIQKRLLQPRQIVQLTDDGFVSITTKRLLSELHFKIDLQELSVAPSRQKSFGQKPVALCIILTLLLLTRAVPALTEQDPIETQTHLFSAIFWAVLLALSVAYAWISRTDILAYFYRYSGKPCLALYFNNPDQQSFDSFVKALNDRLNELNPRDSSSESNQDRDDKFLFSLN